MYPRDLEQLSSNVDHGPARVKLAPFTAAHVDYPLRLELRDGISQGYVTEQGYDWIRISAHCRPGDSGSPVLLENDLIGVVTRCGGLGAYVTLAVVQ